MISEAGILRRQPRTNPLVIIEFAVVHQQQILILAQERLSRPILVEVDDGKPRVTEAYPAVVQNLIAETVRASVVLYRCHVNEGLRVDPNILLGVKNAGYATHIESNALY